MILSMTGYGKSAITTADGDKIVAEIKSLNSKNCDITARIAPQFREKEIEMRNMLAACLERGKVELSLTCESAVSVTAVPLNIALAQGYTTALKQLATACKVSEETDWLNILTRLPGVVLNGEYSAQLTEAQWQGAQKAVREALDNLVNFRKQEGAALADTLSSKIENIRNLFAQIAPYEEERVQKIRSRIIENMEKNIGVDYDRNRLEQELIYYIEKLDISEEKQRLTNHLDYFITTMNGDAGQGKKLGFIAQELGREINTLGSKSNQAEMQNIVIQMKDELEQIKEQVLNVL